MKVVSRYCDSCGVKIPAQDIQDEIALKYEDSYYCKECKAEVLPLLDKKGSKPGGAAAKGGGNGSKDGAPAARKLEAKPAERKASSSAKPAAGAAARRLSSGSSATNRAARKPVVDETESEEELDAEEAPRKRKLLVPAIAGGVLVLAIILGFALRGGGEPPPVVEERAPKAESPKVKSEKAWAAAKAGVREKPLGEQLRSLNEYIQSGAFTDQGALTAAEAEVEALEDKYKAQGDETFKELFKKARELAEVGAYDEAIAALEGGFPADLRDTPAFKMNVRAEVARFERNLAAKAEGEPLLRKAEEYARAKEWALAIAVLEAFDADEYKGCPYSERIEKERRKYDELATATEQDAALGAIEKEQKAAEEKRRAELAEKRRKEDERIASLRWDAIPTDDLFTWKLPPPNPPKDVWKCSGKELTGKSGAGDNVVAWVGAGQKSWQDFIVRFRYKVGKGGFRVGVRSTENGCVELQPEVAADGQWHTMEISVRGGDEDAYQQVLEGVAKTIKFDSHFSAQGGVAFGLLANSECSFTDLQVKVINKSAS